VPRFTSERLRPDHDVSGFRCGVAALDQWLIEHAAPAQLMRTAQTFVWHEGDKRVVAYFSLAAHLVVRAGLPQPLARGSPTSIPAVLLARLALDCRLHGQGLGGELLLDALTRARAAAGIAAARLVVVDAINSEVAAFYEHHGFRPIPDNPNRLVQKMSDIAAALDGTPPRS
jgi:GNAT superfamily N-acetyltransferase